MKLMRTLFIAAAAALVVTAMAATKDEARQYIEGVYAKFANAVKWNSPVAMRNIVYEYCTPDFKAVEYNGRRGDLYTEVDSIITFGRMVDKVYAVDLKLNSFTRRGDRATAVHTIKVDMLANNQGKRERMNIEARIEHSWIKMPSGWKIYAGRTLSEKVTMKPMATPKKKGGR